MTLGARVIKTGLAISLSLYVCHMLGLEPPVFAAVAAVIIMQPSLYGTWRHVWEQIQTNTVGAVMAFLAVHFIGDDLFSVGLVSILVIVISLKMKMGETIGLTLVTVLAIMEAPGDDILYAVNRFGIILVGMISALIVNVAIAPPNFRKMFEDKVRAVFADMSLLLRTAISDEMTEQAFKQNKRQFVGGLKKCVDMYNSFDEERRRMAKIKPVNARQIVVFKHMNRSLHKGEHILDLIGEYYFQYQNNERLGMIFHDHLNRLITYHEYILLKYEGKMKLHEHHGDLSNDNRMFLKNVLELTSEHRDEQLRFVTIGSAIYEYGLELHRLDRLVEHFIKKNKQSGKHKNKKA